MKRADVFSTVLSLKSLHLRYHNYLKQWMFFRKGPGIWRYLNPYLDLHIYVAHIPHLVPYVSWLVTYFWFVCLTCCRSPWGLLPPLIVKNWKGRNWACLVTTNLRMLVLLLPFVKAGSRGQEIGKNCSHMSVMLYFDFIRPNFHYFEAYKNNFGMLSNFMELDT